MKQPNRTAFSLVELSIVLVIIALLTGAILTGKSVLKASELRAVAGEATRYQTAIQTFREKYTALPGDFRSATKFWGTDTAGCPGTASASTAGHTATCNGDGNWMITATATTANELYRAWQHLANEGLIEGTFTGMPANGSAATAVANIVSGSPTNVPVSKFGNRTTWSYVYVGDKAVSDNTYFDGAYGNVLMFGATSTGDVVTLSPEDAWNIDNKIDDGKPGSGGLTSLKLQANAATGCSTPDSSTSVSIAATSSYLLTNTNRICTLVYKTGS